MPFFSHFAKAAIGCWRRKRRKAFVISFYRKIWLLFSVKKRENRKFTTNENNKTSRFNNASKTELIHYEIFYYYCNSLLQTIHYVRCLKKQLNFPLFWQHWSLGFYLDWLQAFCQIILGQKYGEVAVLISPEPEFHFYWLTKFFAVKE